jgi:hypothetical protein
LRNLRFLVLFGKGYQYFDRLLMSKDKKGLMLDTDKGKEEPSALRCSLFILRDQHPARLYFKTSGLPIPS